MPICLEYNPCTLNMDISDLGGREKGEKSVRKEKEKEREEEKENKSQKREGERTMKRDKE